MTPLSRAEKVLVRHLANVTCQLRQRANVIRELVGAIPDSDGIRTEVHALLDQVERLHDALSARKRAGRALTTSASLAAAEEDG